MSADRLSLLVERHVLLLAVIKFRADADNLQLKAQAAQAEAISLGQRIKEIDRYLAEIGPAVENQP
jgi:hypothetical protein